MAGLGEVIADDLEQGVVVGEGASGGPIAQAVLAGKAGDQGDAGGADAAAFDITGGAQDLLQCGAACGVWAEGWGWRHGWVVCGWAGFWGAGFLP